MADIILPGRFRQQPQYAAPLSPELKRYDPKIAVLPSSPLDIASGEPLTLANDVTRRGGEFLLSGR